MSNCGVYRGHPWGRYQLQLLVRKRELRTLEYRADKFSTRKSPIAGQYAGGLALLIGPSSCSMFM